MQVATVVDVSEAKREAAEAIGLKEAKAVRTSFLTDSSNRRNSSHSSNLLYSNNLAISLINILASNLYSR